MVDTLIPAQRINISASNTPTISLFQGFLWFNTSSNKLFIYNGTVFEEYAQEAEVVSLQTQITTLEAQIADLEARVSALEAYGP